MLKNLLKLGAVIALASCGAAEDEVPGVCALDCGSATIGNPNNYSIDAIGADIGDITCSAGTSFTLTQQFKVSRTDASDIGYDGAGNVSTGGGDAAEGEGAKGVPVAGVSMAVTTSGSVFNADDNPVGSDFPEYNGIATPSEEWCTDACGVFKVQLNVTCPSGGGTTSFTVQSGALAKSVELTFVDPAAALWGGQPDYSRQ